MRKYLFIALLILPLFAMWTLPETASARSKSVSNLVGAHSKWSKRLKGDKEFAKKRVLFEVKGQKKATTIEGLLTTVERVLSSAQYSIFIDPLLLAESQGMGYAAINVSGAVVSSVELRSSPPPEHMGLAALVLSYSGSITLPQQVLVNLKPQ